MTEKKLRRIRVRRGGVKALCTLCGVSRATVLRALRYDSDTAEQQLVRENAKFFKKEF